MSIPSITLMRVVLVQAMIAMSCLLRSGSRSICRDARSGEVIYTKGSVPMRSFVEERRSRTPYRSYLGLGVRPKIGNCLR